MNGETLNTQYHKLLGWTFESYGNGGGFWHKEGCKVRARSSTCKCGGHWILPNLTEDANLCIAELDRVFYIQAWRRVRDTNTFALEAWTDTGGKVGYFKGDGATFNEAAIRALIAARTK